MLNSTAVDLPLIRSAVLVSQFLQLYIKKRPCKLYQKSLSDTLVLDEPKLPFLEYCLCWDITQKPICNMEYAITPCPQARTRVCTSARSTGSRPGRTLTTSGASTLRATSGRSIGQWEAWPFSVTSSKAGDQRAAGYRVHSPTFY